MTTTAGAGVTIPYAITTTTPVAVGQPGSPPVGYQLVNRGDGGGTIWVSAGPAGAGAAVALGPYGSMTWQDPTTMPYAALATAGAETLVLTNQSADYANPVAAAAATATQLATQGIPSTYLGAQLVDGGVPYPQLPQVLAGVGKWSSLAIGAAWYSQQGTAGPGVVRLAWDLGGFAVYQYLTIDGTPETSPVSATWLLPVLAPALTISSPAGIPVQSLAVYGTNRAVPAVRQLGTTGIHGLYTSAATVKENLLLPSDRSGGWDQLNPYTRVTGPCSLLVATGASHGLLRAFWADERGAVATADISVPASTQTLLPWNHPAVPVRWAFIPDTAVAGNYCALTVTGT